MTTPVRRRPRRTTSSLRQRLTSVIARHPVTFQVIPGWVERRPGRVVLYLPKRLESPNRWLWTHWRVKHAVSKAWAQVIQCAVLDTPGVDRAAAVTTSPAGGVGWIAPPHRSRVEVKRLVPSERHFITDTTHNLAFASKAVVDCVVKAGFLRDDSDRHIDLQCTQEVSPDGIDWTVIAITAPLTATDATT